MLTLMANLVRFGRKYDRCTFSLLKTMQLSYIQLSNLIITNTTSKKWDAYELFCTEFALNLCSGLDDCDLTSSLDEIGIYFDLRIDCI